MSNVIKFPARTKVYSLSFKITEVFHMTKNDTNSDIGLEIQNGLGTAYVPATTKDTKSTAARALAKTPSKLPNFNAL